MYIVYSVRVMILGMMMPVAVMLGGKSVRICHFSYHQITQHTSYNEINKVAHNR